MYTIQIDSRKKHAGMTMSCFFKNKKNLKLIGIIIIFYKRQPYLPCRSVTADSLNPLFQKLQTNQNLHFIRLVITESRNITEHLKNFNLFSGYVL